MSFKNEQIAYVDVKNALDV